MNEYIFYTDEGYTEGPNEDLPVENCQMLGCHGRQHSGCTHSVVKRKLLD